tara:strand:+ start:57 stop:824 length:768 start_codon:yes stop_codon:yes gene_type:complete
MKIASFNINGIKARLPNLINWLNTSKPEIVALQEIKSVNENFPKDEIEDLGYNIVTHGQKSFNGVAILSKYPIEDISFDLPGNENDDQSRWMEATVGSYRICCLYLPNGNPVDTEKYYYKINFMDRLFEKAKDFIINEQKTIILGDFNVIPYEIDAKNISEWKNDALFRQEIRLKFFKILNIGYTDTIRSKNPSSEIFTFWDYQKRSWERNNGIRIDHILLCPESSDNLVSCGIDTHIRETHKPSDHVPVWIEID